jgi:hypothetical protein
MDMGSKKPRWVIPFLGMLAMISIILGVLTYVTDDAHAQVKAGNVTASAVHAHGYNLKPGRYHNGAFWSGSFANDLYCNDYGAKEPPTARGATAWDRLPTMPNALASKTASAILDIWGSSSGPLATNMNDQATAVRFAMYELQGDKRFKADEAGYYKQLGGHAASIKALVAKMLMIGQSVATSGIRSSLSVPAVVPGATTTATVTVIAGKVGVSNLPVSITVTGGDVNKANTITDGNGRAVFVVTAGTATTSVKVSVRLPAATVTSNSPPKGYQHVYGPRWRSVGLTASFSKRLDLTVKQDCGTTCKGQAPITWTPTPSTAQTQCQALDASGHVVSSIDSSVNKPFTGKFTGNDNVTYRFRCRVQVSKSWTGWFAVGMPFTVICPPWVNVTINTGCDCTLPGEFPVTATFGLSAPSQRDYTVTLTGSDGQTYTSKLGPDPVNLSMLVKASTTATTSFTVKDASGRVIKSQQIMYTKVG